MQDNVSCLNLYKNFNYSTGDYCPAVFDSILCWSPTKAGTNISQHCPNVKGVDTSKYVFRICNDDGTWNSANRTDLIDRGYTNYKPCFTALMLKLVNMCTGMGLNNCNEIAVTARKIEMVGLCLSLISLILSLLVFCRYRVLRNNRTKIHRNLFLATLFQVVIRLIIYVDERHDGQLENINYLCETAKVLLEFSKAATIMWMFIEGLYLHNAITVTVFQEHSYIKVYCYVGWIVPMGLTTVWFITMVNTETDKCWFLYNFLPNYWILEGPSSALIIVNMLFLLNIIRILVMKLRESKMGEIQQVKKAVRAAIFLVPLMGTTNILFMIDYRLFKDSYKFAVWLYTTHFFTSFQGFFIATLYCFLNGEVRDAIKTNFSLYMSIRNDHIHQRNLTETQDPES